HGQIKNSTHNPKVGGSNPSPIRTSQVHAVPALYLQMQGGIELFLHYVSGYKPELDSFFAVSSHARKERIVPALYVKIHAGIGLFLHCIFRYKQRPDSSCTASYRYKTGLHSSLPASADTIRDRSVPSLYPSVTGLLLLSPEFLVK